MGVEKTDVQLLHVPEDVAAQIEHDLLSDPLHEIGLDELEQVCRQQRDQVEFRELRDAFPRVGGKPLGEPRGRRSGLAGQVAIDAHLHEIRARDITEGLEGDRDGGDNSLPPVGLQVVPKPPDQDRVVNLADRVLVLLANVGLRRFRLYEYWLSVGRIP